MTFARPGLLLLLPVVVGLTAFALARTTRRLRRLADGFGGGEAAGRLTTRELTDFPRRRLWILGLAGTLLVLVAAGVRFGPGISLNASRPVDVVVAVDISASMGARDVPGGRMGRAKEVVAALLEVLPGERVGLVVFADWPHTLTPITDDQQVVRFFADSLAENFLGERDQGTRLSAAIGEAQRQLDARREPGRERVILLVTDGEAHEDEFAVADSAALAAGGDVRVWVAGIGTVEGAVVGEDGARAPVTDDSGAPVVSRLNERLLRGVARAGGGGYLNASGDRGLAELADRFRRVPEDGEGSGGPGDAATWLSLLALVLVAADGMMDRPGAAPLRPRPQGPRAPRGPWRTPWRPRPAQSDVLGVPPPTARPGRWWWPRLRRSAARSGTPPPAPSTRNLRDSPPQPETPSTRRARWRLPWARP